MIDLEKIADREIHAPLPDNWHWVRLGEIVRNLDGKRIPVKLDERRNRKSIYPYYGASGIIDFVDDYLFDGDYLLISEDGANLNMRSSPIAFKASGKFWVNNHAHVVQPKNNVLLDYLLYLLAITDLKRYITGAAQPKLTQDDMNSIPIPLPPLDVQRRMVGIIDKQMVAVEQARAAAEMQLEATKALSQAYLRNVFESDEAQKWPRKRIRDFAETCSGSTPSRRSSKYYNGIIPWVKTGELRDSIIFDTEEHISEVALREVSLKLLPTNTLLVAMYGQGQTRGRTGLLSMPATTNQACFAILPSPEKFESLYLQWWFCHSYARLRHETEGRGGNQPNLNGELLRNQQVPFPPVAMQHQIAEKLSDKIGKVKQLCKALEEELAAINALPATLLNQAFTGVL